MHSMQRKVPVKSSGRTSVVRVTVPTNWGEGRQADGVWGGASVASPAQRPQLWSCTAGRKRKPLPTPPSC